MTRAKSSPSAFGGPIDGSDRQPPVYLYRAGHAYVLLTEVAGMVERLARLPVTPVDAGLDLSYTDP